MKLTKDEYHQVSCKLCENMIKVRSSILPALFDELLKLCETHGDIYPILSLCHYYSMWLYKDSLYIQRELQDIPDMGELHKGHSFTFSIMLILLWSFIVLLTYL